MSRNPFKVLGLTPDIVKALGSDEAIMAHVRSSYKALSRVFHPDVGGSQARFVELSQAMEQLDNPGNFQSFKESYLMPRKTQMADLTDQLYELSDVAAHRFDQLSLYLAAFAASGGIDLTGKAVMLQDKVNDSIYQAAVEKVKRGDIRPRRTLFDLVGYEGAVHKHSLKFNRTPPTLFDVFSADEYELTGTPGHFYWAKAHGQGAHRETVYYTPGSKVCYQRSIIGSLSQRDLEEIAGEGNGLRTALAITGDRADFDRARQGYSTEYFGRFLDFLDPVISEGSYLVSVRPNGESIRYFIEGQVLAIRPFSTGSA
jgi:curved DNA-binding protein CbpA